MDNKLVMGYWDCPYCDTKGIEGTIRECPACNHARGVDTKFYMKDKQISYLNEQQSEKKGKGEDWLCQMCDTLNSNLTTVCKSCGAVRTVENKSYSQMKQSQVKPEQPVKVQPNKQVQRKRNYKPLVIIGVIIAFLIWLSMPKTKGFLIESKDWTSSVDIEQYKEVEESNWNMPSDARLKTKNEEIHHYDKVFKGYETQTYQEYEQVGSHEETYYDDNGDGSFTERTRTVPDYDYVTKTREVERYEEIPVYQTKYYYYVWKWLFDHTDSVTDSCNEVYYPSNNYGDDYREGNKRVKYSVSVKSKKGGTKTYNVNSDIWKKLEVGAKYKLKVSGSEILSIEK